AHGSAAGPPAHAQGQRHVRHRAVAVVRCGAAASGPDFRVRARDPGHRLRGAPTHRLQSRLSVFNRCVSGCEFAKEPNRPASQPRASKKILRLQKLNIGPRVVTRVTGAWTTSVWTLKVFVFKMYIVRYIYIFVSKLYSF
ncbi:unnamed protein product, partial [Ixodes persulcatus]